MGDRGAVKLVLGCLVGRADACSSVGASSPLHASQQHPACPYKTAPLLQLASPTTTLSLRLVFSNAVQGTFDANTMTVRLYSGYMVTPRQFERMAGRPQSKVGRDALAQVALSRGTTRGAGVCLVLDRAPAQVFASWL